MLLVPVICPHNIMRNKQYWEETSVDRDNTLFTWVIQYVDQIPLCMSVSA